MVVRLVDYRNLQNEFSHQTDAQILVKSMISVVSVTILKKKAFRISVLDIPFSIYHFHLPFSPN